METYPQFKREGGGEGPRESIPPDNFGLYVGMSGAGAGTAVHPLDCPIRSHPPCVIWDGGGQGWVGELLPNL